MTYPFLYLYSFLIHSPPLPLTLKAILHTHIHPLLLITVSLHPYFHPSPLLTNSRPTSLYLDKSLSGSASRCTSTSFSYPITPLISCTSFRLPLNDFPFSPSDTFITFFYDDYIPTFSLPRFAIWSNSSFHC